MLIRRFDDRIAHLLQNVLANNVLRDSSIHSSDLIQPEFC